MSRCHIGVATWSLVFVLSAVSLCDRPHVSPLATKHAWAVRMSCPYASHLTTRAI